MRELLETLDLKNVVFTLDALHCKKTLEIIAEQNDYVVKVKRNQQKLHNEIKQTTEISIPTSEYTEP